MLLLLFMLLLLVGYGFNPQAAEDVDLFPRVKEKGNETEKAFPLNITVDTFSDVVLVRCPGDEYTHTTALDGSFKQKGISGNQKFSSIEKPEKKISWKAVFIDNPAKREVPFNCGELILKTTPVKFIEWELLIKWENEPKPLSDIETADVELNIVKPSFSKCGIHFLLFIKDNKNNINEYKHHTTDIFNGNFIYVFKRDHIEDTKNFAVPCTIMKPVLRIPEIVLNRITTTDDNVFSNTTILVFPLDKEEKQVDFSLLVDTDSNEKVKKFFSNEHVTIIFQMIDKEKNIQNTNEEPFIGNKIILKKYQLFKVSFSCPECERSEQYVEKMFFVGPTMKNYIEHDIPTKNFKEGNLKEKPHCSIIHNTYGILQTMSYTENNAATSTNTTYDSIKDGSLVNGFKINNDIVEFEKANPNGRFTCVYTIPGGTYTIRKDFKCHSESAVIRDDKGVEFLPGQPGYEDLKEKNDKANKAKIKAELEEAKRKEEEAKRIAAERMRNTIIGSSVGGMLIFVVIFIVLFFLNKKKIQYYQMKKRLARDYPMVFKFWEFIQVLQFKEICKLLEDKQYIPMDPPLKKVSKENNSDVDEDEIDFSFYDQALIKPKDGTTPYCFKAYGLSSMYNNKKYILSEGPKLKDSNDFWKMIYDNDVEIIAAIIYQNFMDDTNVYEKYWPESKMQFGDIDVKCEKIKDVNLVSTKMHQIKMVHKGRVKNLSLYFITDWKSGSIPESAVDLIDLYDYVFNDSSDSSKSNVVIHSSGHAGSRCFLFTYFAIIIEALKYGTDSSNPSHWNPMQIIKDVREKVYGGELSGLEFSFLINSVVEYFAKKKIIPENDNFFLFTRDFQEYIHRIRIKESSHISSIKSFLIFINTLDHGKAKSLVQGFIHLNANKSSLIPLSQKYMTALAIQNKIKAVELKKFEALYKGTYKQFNEHALKEQRFVCRYNNIYSLDKTTIPAFDDTTGPDEYDNFMHANRYTYKVKNVFSREMILCQAPFACRNSRMIDMIYQQEVSGVINLCRNDELTKGRWQIYYPTRIRIIKDMSQFIGLYKTIIRLTEKKKILIHCSAGIGRTGTLALFMTLVDTLEAGKHFDMKNALIHLRNCRAQAVQTPEQYLMVIKALLLYYKDQVEKFDEGLYEKVDIMVSDVIKMFKEKK
uniref:Tyrosine-protein phosphatase domain-containing protein n=1 Tax=Parastrongyloides trichosuri TaxID=131310 RepID=A0A0N4Z9R5_PARTI